MTAYTVANGQSISGLVLNNGDYLTIESGGTATNTTVNSGAFIVNEGDSNDTNLTGGFEQAENGGVTNNATINNSSSFVHVESGGSSNNIVVNDGGYETLDSNSISSNTTINDGFEDVRSGSTASGTIVNGNGSYLTIDGTANNAVLYNGTMETVRSGGITNNTTVHAGATLYVESGGSENGTTNDGGTVDDQNTPCYCPGTRILTARGEVAVEALAIDDVVVTASGEHRPIKWIGHRGYIGRFANANPDVLPICIHAGALADGVPARDLWVSPKHALFLDGVLIPAECLVNGATIVKAERVESVAYWHVELDSHDVLLAEGAPAESFVDDNGRGIFHNAGTYAALYPDARRAEAVYCAPRVEDGFALDAVRRRLAARAGLPAVAGPGYGALEGFVERVEGGVVHGWAVHAGRPGVPVCLDVLVGGALAGLVLAETFRGDLLAAGIGEGRHGFRFALPAGASGEVSVRRSRDGAVLPGLADAAVLRVA